jgi:predicted Zn finger-like uncharacterized protein
MDVRCERCKAQYAFLDDQITPQGLTVRCTNCGHVFKVRKKELVVTVPASPEEVAGAIPATLGATRQGSPLAGPGRGQGWTLRRRGGAAHAFDELSTLQRWIVERKVGRDDEVSRGDEGWARLGSLGELTPFFELVEAADRAGGAGGPTRAGMTDLYSPPVPIPVPSRPATPVQAAITPSAAPPTDLAAAEPSRDLDAAELAAAGAGGRRRSGWVAMALLLVALGAAAYVFAPAILGHREPASPAEAPPAPRPPPEPAIPPPAEPPPPAPPAAAVRPEPPPEPKAEPEPRAAPASPAPGTETLPTKGEPPGPAPKPAGTRARLAQAAQLRDKGETARALELFGKVVRDEPDNVAALTGRGLCYFELSQYGPAEASFQQALLLAPDDPDATMGLAETYRQEGKKAEALALFQRYLAAHPDGEEAAVARSAISQLKE